MNRKEVRGGGSRRGNDTDMRRKEKENRKLQLELRSEKEKLNSAIIKYQKEINEMQAVGVPSSPRQRAVFLRSPLTRLCVCVAATVGGESDAHRAADGAGQPGQRPGAAARLPALPQRALAGRRQPRRRARGGRRRRLRRLVDVGALPGGPGVPHSPTLASPEKIISHLLMLIWS